MKVIKEGAIPAASEWKVEVECEKCGTGYEATVDDLGHFHYFGTHFRHDYPGVRCERCGTIVFVKDVPEPIADKVLLEKPSVFDGVDHRIY